MSKNAEGRIKMSEIIQSDVRKVYKSATAITSATAIGFLRREGLGNNVALYLKNDGTAAVYCNFKGSHINTSSTTYWYSIGATCTVGTGAVTCYTQYTISALQNPSNYIGVEYVASATGMNSATTMMLSVW